MNKKLFLASVFFFVLCAVNLFAQDDLDFPSVKQSDVSDGMLHRESYFEGETLWGIINGGADIYLEYGFDKLLLQEIDWKGTNFRVEFYRMKDAAAAYGIFSIMQFKCNVRDTLSKFVCVTPFQTQAAVGRFYISIANDKGTKEAMRLNLQLFEYVLSRSNEVLFEIPAVFKKKEISHLEKNIKVIRGELGFQNSFQNWWERFAKFKGYTVCLAVDETDETHHYYSLIKFSSSDDLKQFVLQQAASTNVKTKIIGDKELLFVESNNFSLSQTQKFFE